MLTVYKASAGSGKTYQLTLHYIKNLLGVKKGEPGDERWVLNQAYRDGMHPNTHRQILAITFTNKSTEEMKKRIIDSLYQIGTGEHKKYIEGLTKIFGCSAEELGRAARTALSSLLLDYKFFNVSTIDSFFQSILRSFAYELDVQGDYDVELGTTIPIRDALNDILEQVNYRRGRRKSTEKMTDAEKRESSALDKIDKWLMKLVRRQIDQDKTTYNPFQRGRWLYSSLVKEISQIYKEDFKQRETAVRDYLIEREGALKKFEEALKNRREEIEKSASDIANSFESILGRHGHSLDNLNGTSYKRQILGLKETPPKWPKISDTFRKIANGEQSPEKAVTSPNKSLLSSQEDLEAIRTKTADLIEAVGQRTLLDVIQDGLIYLEFTGYMLKAMSSINDSKNRIVLGDTNRLIHQIIDGSDAPFIYERIGVYLKNFLIDEFQDTSRMQWQNLLPLVKNALASNDDSLIIGDTKQAIYRFRNSDSTMLGRTLREQDFADDATVKEMGNDISENTNYRTSQTIVRFNNTFFPVFAETIGQRDGYRGGEVMQQSPEDRHSDVCPGYIRMIPYGEGGESEATPETCADMIVESIKDAHNRGYSYSDIAILVRRHTDPKAVIDRLIEADIPVQSSDSLIVSAARSVKMLVSLLHTFKRIGEGRRSEGGKKMTYEDTLFILSRVDYLIAADPSKNWRDALDEAIDQFNDQSEYAPLETLKEIAKSHPSSLPAVVESIIAAGLVPKELLANEKDYIAAFVDFVNDYSEEHDDDLKGFLTHWEDKKKKLSLPPPPTSDAVVVTTVHQSKGLEWPIVHVPLFEWPIKPPVKETKWVTTHDETDRATGLTRSAELDVKTVLGLKISEADIPPLLKLQISNKIIGLNKQLDELAKSILSLQAVDLLNLVYVAFTRPMSELHVYYKNSPGKEHCGGFLRTTLDKLLERGDEPGFDANLETVIDDTIYNEETGELTIGEPTRKKPKEEKESEVKKEPETVKADFYFSTYRPDTDIIVKVSAIDTDEITDEEDEPGTSDELSPEARMEAAADRGIRYHAILEKMINRRDLDEAIASTPFDSDEDREAARELLAKAIEHPGCRDWFGESENVAEIRTEMTLFAPNPLDIFDNGDISRLDRVVFHTDGTIEIVDYKFTTGRRSENESQVDRYVELINQIYPGRPVKASLWYVDLNVIESVKTAGRHGSKQRNRRTSR